MAPKIPEEYPHYEPEETKTQNLDHSLGKITKLIAQEIRKYKNHSVEIHSIHLPKERRKLRKHLNEKKKFQ